MDKLLRGNLAILLYCSALLSREREEIERVVALRFRISNITSLPPSFRRLTPGDDGSALVRLTMTQSDRERTERCETRGTGGTVVTVLPRQWLGRVAGLAKASSAQQHEDPKTTLLFRRAVDGLGGTAAEKPVQTLAFDLVTQTNHPSNIVVLEGGYCSFSSSSFHLSITTDHDKPLSSAEISRIEQVALASSDYARAACVRTSRL